MSRRIYLFFGPPGSGKGTQSDMLGVKLGLPIISAGELLRAEQNAQSRLGRRIGPIIDQGKLVPGRLIYKLVKKHPGRTGCFPFNHWHWFIWYYHSK